jgi:limonene-1,2-epoxide hydrolase
MDDLGSKVREFFMAWTEPDLDRLMQRLTPYVADDAVLRQMPFAEVRGHEGLRRICGESLESMSNFEVDIVSITAVGTTVFTERVDRFVLRGREVAVPVLGVFEFGDDGRITAWRDYFDSKPLFFDSKSLFQRSSG